MHVEDQAVGDKWALYQADNVPMLNEQLSAEKIDLTVTSIPFASLFTYSNSDRDFGNCKSHGEFFEHFAFWVKGMLRVTKPGRLAAIHLMNLPTSKTRDGHIGLVDFRGAVIRAMVEGGWIYASEVCIWKCPVVAVQRTKALGLLWKQLRKDSSMSRMGLPDYLTVFRKPGENGEPVTHTHESFPVEQWQQWASPVWMDIDQGDTLQRESAREEKDEKHICPLQLGVIERALTLWSNPGDLILDPFAGIGSTGYVAIKNGRRFIGIELKGSYFKQAAANLAEAAAAGSRQGDLFA